MPFTDGYRRDWLLGWAKTDPAHLLVFVSPRSRWLSGSEALDLTRASVAARSPSPRLGQNAPASTGWVIAGRAI